MSEMVKWQLCRDVALLRLHGVCCGVAITFARYGVVVWQLHLHGVCGGVAITSARYVAVLTITSARYGVVV